MSNLNHRRKGCVDAVGWRCFRVASWRRHVRDRIATGSLCQSACLDRRTADEEQERREMPLTVDGSKEREK